MTNRKNSLDRSTMKTMKVMRFNDSMDHPAMIADEAPVPRPAANEVLVRVHAVGVTPTERLWYPTSHAANGERRTGAIFGHEFSGVVEAAGSQVEESRICQEVFGMNDWFADGATADYCTAISASVTAKPLRLSHAESASVPIGALTAWQGLFDRAKLKSGERVLVHGGSGAVGLFAIQLAKRAGARIATTASARNFGLLSRLGVEELTDYRTERFEDRVRPVDVVFDAVGGETLKRSWDLLKPAGRMVTIAADSERNADHRTEEAFFIVEPNQEQLAEIARLLDAAEIEPFVDCVVPFSEASEAYFGRIEGRRGYGKVVLSLTA
jgi:NADPH:quinone reductase-like Zn-dependent oxidoreductase